MINLEKVKKAQEFITSAASMLQDALEQFEKDKNERVFLEQIEDICHDIIRADERLCRVVEDNLED